MSDAYYALKMILKVSQCEINFMFIKIIVRVKLICMFIKIIVRYKRGLQRCIKHNNIKGSLLTTTLAKNIKQFLSSRCLDPEFSNTTDPDSTLLHTVDQINTHAV